MFWLYNVLFLLGFLVASPYYLWRMIRRGGYARDFGQRFAFYRTDIRAALARGGAIWIHSVSVGEKNAVARVCERLRDRYPGVPLVWSTTTSTGYAGIREMADRGIIPIYFPLDFPWIVRRAVRLIRPRALILVESEVWPNLIRRLSRQGVPVALINARISPRSYRRYQQLGCLARRVFGLLDLVCAQEAADRQRLADLGIPPERIHVVGSLKFDAAIPQPAEAMFDPWALLNRLGVDRQDPILLGGSTWPGEEAALLDIQRELRREFPRLFLVLVPRHAERTPEVVQAARERAVRFLLRTELPGGPGEVDCLIVNTTGELRTFYEVATVVFVGKSLFETVKSLQNPIEPAALGKPVIVGPHIESFEAIVKKFLAADGIVRVADVAELQQTVRALLRHPRRRDTLGANARRVVEENRGAVERTVTLLESLLAR